MDIGAIIDEKKDDGKRTRLGLFVNKGKYLV
jgi:hypothetical protein